MVADVEEVGARGDVRRDRAGKRFADPERNDADLRAARAEKAHEILDGTLVVGDHACRPRARPADERLVVWPNFRLECAGKCK